MSERFTLSIPKPCHEQWDTFTPTEKGGFCASCQKEVIDFTQWSNEQIRQYVSKNAQRLCGRFRTDQLKTYPDVDQSRLSRMTLPAMALSLLFTANETQAQILPIGTHQTTTPSDRTAGNTDIPEIQTRTIHVSGTVRTDSVTAAAGASVYRKGTNESITADINGEFDLTLHDVDADETLIIHYIGYYSQEICIPTDQSINVQLEPDTRMRISEIVTTLGAIGYIYKSWTPRWMWWKITNIFR